MLGEKQNRSDSRLAEAESLILEAKPLFIRHYGETHIATITADGTLATLAFTRGDFAQSERMREALSINFRKAGEGDYSYIWSLYYLGEAKYALGKDSESEMLFNQALELGGRHWGANDFRFKRLHEYVGKARAAARG